MSDAGYPRETTEFDRGLSFFDAIYGVAITLLIVGIDPPSAQNWSSWSALVDSGVIGQLVTALISFAVIASFWKLNHSVMARVVRLDGAVINANLVAVAFVVLIPLTTAALGEPGVSETPWPTAVYAVVMVLASLAQRSISVVAAMRGVLARAPGPQPTVWAELAAAAVTPVVFLASIPVAFLVSSDAAQLAWISLAALGPFAHGLTERYTVRPSPPSA